MLGSLINFNESLLLPDQLLDLEVRYAVKVVDFKTMFFYVLALVNECVELKIYRLNDSILSVNPLID